MYYASTGSHLSASNVFLPEASDIATITLAGTGTAEKIIQPYGAAATLTTELNVADTDLTYTANTAGLPGNAITITYENPLIANQTLYVEVQGKGIIVHLVTDSNSDITSTAAQVMAVVQAHGVANSFVTVTAPGATTGVVTAMSKTNLTNLS